MMLRTSSNPFPNPVMLAWTDNVEGVETPHRIQVRKGRNAIFKNHDGRLSVESEPFEAPDSQEFSQNVPLELAVIDATLLDLDGIENIQLELSATEPYTSVHRSGSRFAVLSPDHEKQKCCCLTDGDTIHFTSIMTSIMVSNKPGVQVNSSLPIEDEKTILSAEITATTSIRETWTTLNGLGTPNRSNSEAAIEETPARAKPPDDLHEVPQSPEAPEDDVETAIQAPADDTESDEDKADTDSKFDSPSHQPSVTTIVHESRKRSLEFEEISETSIAKKSRASKEKSEDAEDELDSKRITTLDEDEPDLVVLKKRGRPKKEAKATPKPKPKPHTSPSVLIEKKGRKTTATPKSATPRSTARSTASANSPAPSSSDSKKQNVTFSSSGFTELPQQMKMFKAIAFVSTKFSKKTDILCISGGLKKTPKILSAVALGKPIVTDDWAKECAKQQSALPLEKYLARDEKKEKEWDVPDSWSAGEESRADLMKGFTLYITPSLKNIYGAGYKDIEDLAKLVGAKKVISKPHREAPEDEENTVLMGLHNGDLDLIALHSKGRKVYEKDFLPMSILRGELCLDDFDIEPEEGLSSGKKKKGAKK